MQSKKLASELTIAVGISPNNLLMRLDSNQQGALRLTD